MRLSFHSLRSSLVIALALAGCASQGWDQVRAQDATQAYRRFVAEHPNSPHVAEAKERLAVLQLERDPTVEALARFRSEHPDSAATTDLSRRLEARAFEAARAEATPGAYDHFLAAFPNGEFAARASGNATYLRAGGFAGRLDALAAFVQQASTSDYTIEAQRTIAGVEARRSGHWASVGLHIEIANGVGDAALPVRGACTARANHSRTRPLSPCSSPSIRAISMHTRCVMREASSKAICMSLLNALK